MPTCRRHRPLKLSRKRCSSRPRQRAHSRHRRPGLTTACCLKVTRLTRLPSSRRKRGTRIILGAPPPLDSRLRGNDGTRTLAELGMTDDDREAELEEGRMPLLDHLIELRNRLMWSIGALLVAFLICYQFK